jgi:hypothetical protein
MKGRMAAGHKKSGLYSNEQFVFLIHSIVSNSRNLLEPLYVTLLSLLSFLPSVPLHAFLPFPYLPFPYLLVQILLLSLPLFFLLSLPTSFLFSLHPFISSSMFVFAFFQGSVVQLFGILFSC